MTTVDVHCQACGAAAPPVEPEAMDTELAAAGWAISHGQTYCPTCGAARGLSSAPTGPSRSDLALTSPPSADGDRTLDSSEPRQGTLTTQLGVREARRIVRRQLELNPAAHRERWDEERRVMSGLVLGRRVYASPWWGRGAYESPYSYHLRGRLRKSVQGGCELRWRIYRGSVLGWVGWAGLSIFVFLLALAAFVAFAARGGTGPLLFGLGALAGNIALIVGPRLVRDRWKTIEVGMLTDWVAELDQELQSGRT
jgi:hypothetical protein